MFPSRVPILNAPIINWWCPNCASRSQTQQSAPHVRYHTCPGNRMMSVPMLREGEVAKVTLHDREDYVGDEEVQRDENGRPVMSVTVERADGSNDTAVYAPTATARAE